MDPAITLDWMETSLASGNDAEALDSAYVYLNWRVKGGFEPVRVSDGARGDDRAAAAIETIIERLD